MLHHVMNISIAERALFRTREEVGCFQEGLARAAAARQLEVHAFTFLPEEFHLIVRSRHGHLSEAMKEVQNDFVRWFNRRHARDGALFRGRFLSRPVLTSVYERVLVRFVDSRSVRLGVVDRPADYPFGSARLLVRDELPPWLSPALAERCLRRVQAPGGSRPERYRRWSHQPFPEAWEWLVAQRCQHPATLEDPLDELLAAGRQRLMAWIQETAEHPEAWRWQAGLVAPRVVVASTQAARTRDPQWRVRPRKNSKSGWEVLVAGLVRCISRLGASEAAPILGFSPGSVQRYTEDFRSLLAEDELFRSRAGEVLQDALRSCYRSRLPAQS